MSSNSYTKEEQAAYVKKHYKKHKQLYIQRSANRYKKLRDEHPEKMMCYNAKSRAKQFGWEFSITHEDFKIPEMCPIMQIPLFFSKGRQSTNTPTLDRIDNTKGYIKGNVQVISQRANVAKGNLCIADVKRLLKYMEDHEKTSL